MTTLSCLRCHHSDEVDTGGLSAEEFASGCVLKCSECSARMAYGSLIPRMVVSAEDKFVTLSIDGVKHRMDRAFALELCINLISVSK